MGKAMFSSISKGMFKRPTQDAAQSPMDTSGTRQEADTPPIEVQIKSPSAVAEEKRYQPPVRSSVGIKSPSAPPVQRSPQAEADYERGTTLSVGPKIISVGGGKGGIGKSFFSANIAICLAKLGHKVAIVDLDLGAANLHTCLGVPCPKIGIFDFVNNRVENLSEIGVPCGVPNLTLYGGGQEFWQQVRPQSVQKIRLISKLQKLDADYVLLDLGAGTHVNTLDFFIFSHAGIVVVVPEPTSIENAYVFLKSVLVRKLQSILKAVRQEGASEQLLAQLSDPKSSLPPYTLLHTFAQNYPESGQKILQLIQMTHLGIVMNQVRTKADADIGQSMTQICKRYFGFSAEFLGAAGFDDAVWKSVRSRKPLCAEVSDSEAARNIQEIAEAIAERFIPPSNGKAAS